MPFIPHTSEQISEMLDKIGVASIHELFDEIPENLRCDNDQSDGLEGIADGLTEHQVIQKLTQLARRDGNCQCFAGAGAYEHFIPSAVWEITTRGEFYSAYTPYQAEASQGTLQLIYEFQSMIASLTAMDVANASLYDGASALAEAILMAVRANRKAKSKTILIPKTVSPFYREVAYNITHNQGIELEFIDYDQVTGCINPDMAGIDPEKKYAALVIPMPNFFGNIESIHHLTDWAHQRGALVIAQINPMALGIFEAPGNWGEKGADIMVGEAQPLGIPLASGGPYLGIMACKMPLVRQLPGRIIGKTEDMEGHTGFALTLQAREQHIRRSKATSNICTNQGLLATATTIYLALMGSEGIYRTAVKSYQNTCYLKQQVETIAKVVFSSPHFHEIVVQLPVDASTFIEKMAQKNYVAGVALGKYYPELENCILLCCTETKNNPDIEQFVSAMSATITEISKGK